MIEVWTDGSGLARAEGTTMLPIGYAWVCRIGNQVVEMAVYDPAGTNNTAELKAPLTALRALNPQACLVSGLTVRSDSTYVIGQATGQYRTNLHHALISELQALSRERNAAWVHCRGHTGDWGNERADALAGWARLNGSGDEPKVMRFAWFDLEHPEDPFIEKHRKETVRVWDGQQEILIRSLV